MPNILINNTNYYYELHGAGDVIVLINGLKADHAGWLPVLEALQKHNTVLIFDNLGVGRTTDDGAEFTVDRMADDTMALVKQVGLKKPYIVGHSLGGAVAQVIAHRYPNDIQRVALCNTFMKLNDSARAVFSNVLSMYQAGSSQADIMRAILPHVFSPDFLTPTLEKMICEFSENDPYAQSEHDYARQLHALYSFDSRAWLHEIEMPTLVISSKQDQVALPAESEQMATILKNSTLIELNTGHASQLEKPADFVSALMAFREYHKND